MSRIMTIARFRSFARLAALTRRLQHDQRGVSAVEFALLLPLMVALYLGAVELSQGIATNRKVTLVARTVSDLVSRVQTINNNDLTNSLNAAKAVMAPHAPDKLTVVVSSVEIDDRGRATVLWSEALNGSARARNSRVTIPDALAVPNTTLIWSEASYRYAPVIGDAVTGPMTFRYESFARPRLSAAVERT